MLDKMTYTNHKGQTIEFGATEGDWKGLLIGISDVRDYAWSYDTTNDKISNFKKGVVTKSLPYFVVSDKADIIKNNICAIADIDVRAGKKGVLDIDGNKLNCYIYSVTTKDFLINYRYRAGTIGIATDDATWRIYEDKQEFLKKDEGVNLGIDYPYDYPYDYYFQSNITGKLRNKSVIDSDFILTIAGPVTTPTILISGNTYKFNISLLKDEYLIVNSMNKTIIKQTIPTVTMQDAELESTVVDENEKVKYYVQGSIEFQGLHKTYAGSGIVGFNEFSSSGNKLTYTSKLFNGVEYALNPETTYITLYCYESIYDKSKANVQILSDLSRRNMPETSSNEFNCRNKAESVFTKIPVAEDGNDILWDGTFNFDISLIYEQSEPKWGGA